MKKLIAKLLAVILALALLVGGGVLGYFALDAGVAYSYAESEIGSVGDNYKAQQKANDNLRFIKSMRNKWISLWCAAASCLAAAIAIFTALLIKKFKSKNIRE